MLEAMLDQFMKTSDGASMLQSLTGAGLSPQQAQQVVTTTAEGVASQGGQGGFDVGAITGGLMGGAGGGLGQLAGMLGGGGTSASAATGSLDGLVGPIAQLVAQKVGIAPAMATTVVKLVLPKIAAMLTGAARPS